ncbi:MAG: AmmeMemoRadiSam system radical SAM enzyme [Desulfobacteraceae bacterium]|nr:AmmeMemoRadiSam system radical SAM enzyme [Desulfobacteraceae bacterium]
MEAYLYETLEKSKVRCFLCSHQCLVNNGKRGLCGVRENRRGKLYSLVYGRLIASNADPIEKKPLFHFMPGSRSYSIATAGCNFRCKFCQNADIAQMPNDQQGLIIGTTFNCEGVVKDALNQNCQSISYTYTEPTIYFEFAHDTAKLAHSYGLKNAFVTNGYMSSKALEMISPYLDAANVDLKSFSDKYYKQMCGARLAPVKETLKQMKAMNILVEVTTLIVPGLNDDPEELHAIAGFIANDLGPETPWHISRFHPTYQLTDRDCTPVQTLKTARDIGLEEGLRYVYLGNVPGHDGESTSCHHCGSLLIERWGYVVQKNRIKEGACPGCKTVVYGIDISA